VAAPSDKSCSSSFDPSTIRKGVSTLGCNIWGTRGTRELEGLTEGGKGTRAANTRRDKGTRGANRGGQMNQRG